MDAVSHPPDHFSVLVVDDHHQVRAALCEWISAFLPRGSIRQAGSGEEAVAGVRAERPTVVVMDFKLPGMNGVEATRAIRALAPGLPVILLSVYSGERYEAEALAAGAAAFVAKDDMHIRLLPLIARLLRDPAGVRPEPQG
jgi:two-component system invasion response regulator UvrY